MDGVNEGGIDSIVVGVTVMIDGPSDGCIEGAREGSVNGGLL